MDMLSKTSYVRMRVHPPMGGSEYMHVPAVLQLTLIRHLVRAIPAMADRNQHGTQSEGDPQGA